MTKSNRARASHPTRSLYTGRSPVATLDPNPFDRSSLSLQYSSILNNIATILNNRLHRLRRSRRVHTGLPNRRKSTGRAESTRSTGCSVQVLNVKDKGQCAWKTLREEERTSTSTTSGVTIRSRMSWAIRSPTFTVGGGESVTW